MQGDVISALAETLRSDDRNVLARGKKLLLHLASTRTLLAFSTDYDYQLFLTSRLEDEGAQAIAIADPNFTSFCNVGNTDGGPTSFRSAIREAVVSLGEFIVSFFAIILEISFLGIPPQRISMDSTHQA
jgi:hypothetical protein